MYNLSLSTCRVTSTGLASRSLGDSFSTVGKNKWSSIGEGPVARSSKVTALLLAMTLKRKEFEKFVMLRAKCENLYAYTGYPTRIALMG
jgi:hypothetical protein